MHQALIVLRRALILPSLLLLGLSACGPTGTPEEETTPEPTGTPPTQTSAPVEVSDGGGDGGLGGDDDEVVQPTETTEYVEQGEGTEEG